MEGSDQPSDDVPGTDLVKVNVSGISIDLGLADFIGRVIGEPLEQAGGILRDLLGMVRFELSLKLLRRAQRKLEEAGLDHAPLRPISLTRLLPILESGSVESEASMQERWAALLASAIVDPEGVPPAFPEILRQLEPREAALLDALFEAAMGDGGLSGEWRMRHLAASDLADVLGLRAEGYDIAINNLIRLRVCSPVNNATFGGAVEDLSQVVLTGFGYAFVRACRSPSPAR
jgi:hypothetical protein